MVDDNRLAIGEIPGLDDFSPSVRSEYSSLNKQDLEVKLNQMKRLIDEQRALQVELKADLLNQRKEVY